MILYFPRPRRIGETLFSSFRSPDIEASIVHEILDQYGLHVDGKLRNLPNTRRNHNLIVDTDAGRAVLKRYRADWRPQTIAFEHAVLTKLETLGITAPLPFATAEGETFIRCDGKYYAIFHLIPGRNYASAFLLRSQRLHLMHLAGEAMAQVHAALEGFLPNSPHHLGFKSYDGPRHHDRKWHDDTLAELEAAAPGLRDPEQKALAGWLVEHAGEVVDKMDALDRSLAARNLRRLIIHGDYGLHNLLIDRKRSVVPVDYELARLEWRLSDLVSCLSRLRSRDGAYDDESIRKFLSGYQRRFPIPPDELDALPVVWQFYKLKSAIQYWYSFMQTNGPTRKLHSAKDAVFQARWAAGNADRILGWAD